MEGGIEAMLKVLEDPNSDQFDEALGGLIAKYQEEGPNAFRPFKDQFRKKLRSRDETSRVIAAWALGRTGDFDVVPILIRSLLDTDEDVVAAARSGLQLLSRKIDGYGPADNATSEQKQEAAKKWAAWYQSVKPPELDAPEEFLAANASKH
jgi:HEAT repeat protein